MTLKSFIQFCSPYPQRSFGIAQKHLSVPLICILKANLRSAGLRAQVLNYVWTCSYRDDIMNLKLLSFQDTTAEGCGALMGEKGTIEVTQQKITACRCVFTSKHCINIQGENPLTSAPAFSSLLFFFYIPFTFLRSLS